MMPITLPSSASNPGTNGRSLRLTAARGSRNLIVAIYFLPPEQSCLVSAPYIGKLAMGLQPLVTPFTLTAGLVCISSYDDDGEFSNSIFCSHASTLLCPARAND